MFVMSYQYETRFFGIPWICFRIAIFMYRHIIYSVMRKGKHFYIKKQVGMYVYLAGTVLLCIRMKILYEY